VERTDDGQYALGSEIIALTQAARVNVELRDSAAPLLRGLADACRESVYLMSLDGDCGLYIYAIESPQRLLARTAVGDRAPLHCTSVGKAILSGLPSKKVEGIISRVGLPKFTDITLTDPEALYEDLERTRARGYALDAGEHEVDTYCIGAPILDKVGQVIASCSVSGSDPEIVDSRRAELAARVKYTAQEISRRMGYVPSSPSAVVLLPTVAQTTEANQ
jgi:DNA-binding IclR family transcriptional regulator